MTKKRTNKLIRIGLALAGFAALQTNATAAAKTKPTFTEDVAPIIYNNCTECHRNGQAAPFMLKNYNDVKKRARLITKVTQDRYMPPWHPVQGHGKFVDERRLSADELATLKNWHATGMAEGPTDELPNRPSLPATGCSASRISSWKCPRPTPCAPTAPTFTAAFVSRWI